MDSSSSHGDAASGGGARRPRTLLIGAAVALTATLLGAGGVLFARSGSDSGGSVARPAPSAVPGNPAPAQPGGTISTTAGVKPELRGLLDRDGLPPEKFLSGALGGFVVKAYWRDLQPTADSAILADNVIDAAVAEVRRRNAAAGGAPQLGIKLRVYAGNDAPDWAQRLDGEPVTLQQNQTLEVDTVGRFWTPKYAAAYARLQQLLAEKYDGVPEIRETVISRCTTFFAEPFLREKRIPENVTALLGAGFTTAADRTCHTEQIDAHRVWTRTRSVLTLNPYTDLEVDKRGRQAADDEFTYTMMDYCRGALGERCVLENNALSDPPKYPELYARMQQLGAPIAFQTATAARIGDLQAAIRRGRELGAASVELPISYRQEPPDLLVEPNRALLANG